MLISRWSDKLLNIKALFTNHFKCFPPQIKACLLWKLYLISFPGQLTTMEPFKYTKVLVNCVYNTPNFVIQLLWSYKFSFFSQLKITFYYLTDLGQMTSMGVFVICIVFSKTTRNWILVFWFPKSIDKNNKSRQSTWNGPLARRNNSK